MTIYTRWGIEVQILAARPEWEVYENAGKDVFLIEWLNVAGSEGELRTHPFHELRATDGINEVLEAARAAPSMPLQVMGTAVIMGVTTSRLIREAVSIQWLVVAHGGMAFKSEVEDVLMARHPNVGRGNAHEALNQIEFLNLTLDKMEIQEPPTMDDYPEIFEYVTKWFWA